MKNNKPASVTSNKEDKKVDKKSYEKPSMTEQQPLERATTFTYYFYR